ncbi:MAG: hypothetical protein IT262_08485 [Saprospiraceae bacterium]|nr:hypothetical protein [Saprospiraceae bacterium]
MKYTKIVSLQIMTIYNTYDEIAAMLAVIDPVRLMNLKASADTQQRLELLMERSKENPLSKYEKDELDHYIVLERLIRLAKIRARTNQ